MWSAVLFYGTVSLILPIPMNVMSIDAITARTTLRLWHDLNTEKRISHDFQDVFDPSTKSVIFLAGVVNDEIKAIAQCTRAESRHAKIRRVAHAPLYETSGEALVHLLSQQRVGVTEALRRVRVDEELHGVGVEGTLRIKQPRWYVAYSFYGANGTGTILSSVDRE